jgi:hypothetical protein
VVVKGGKEEERTKKMERLGPLCLEYILLKKLPKNKESPNG